MEAFIVRGSWIASSFSCFSDLLGGDATPNGVSWNVFGDHCTSRDHGALSDRDAGKYRNARSYPCAILDGDVFADQSSFPGCRGIRSVIVVVRIQDAVWANCNFFADIDIGCTIDDAVVPDVRAISDLNLARNTSFPRENGAVR